MKFHDKLELSFDDVLLLPRKSRVKSRLEPDVSTKLTKNITIDIPLCAAAMDTVVDTGFSIVFSKLGGAPFLHRFMSDEETIDSIKKINMAGGWVVASVGLRKGIVSWCLKLQEAGAKAISFDIAHADNVDLLNAVEACKKVLSVDVIGGNVCTQQGVINLIESGVDAVKLNIGSGAACSTRVNTGCGRPTFSTIVECSEVAKSKGVPAIADGGIKNGGDVSKNLAAGASSCMLGHVFSQAEEAPGENMLYEGRRYKAFRGMSSEAAQRVFKGGMKDGIAAEGESMLVPVSGPLKNIVRDLVGGLRSAMSYCDALTIPELQENAEFTRITVSSYEEGLPHGLKSAVKGIK